MTTVETKSPDDSALQALHQRGVAALAEYFDQYRPRLKRCVDARIDRRISARLDDSDVIQETFLTAAERLDNYLNSPKMPLFLWLRLLAQQTALNIHKAQVKTHKRNPLQERRNSDPVRENLLNDLSTSMLSPHSMIVRAEFQKQVRELLNAMSDNDREILTLVHLEQLSTSEAASILNLPTDTVRKRHLRATKRLRAIIEELEETERS